METPTTVPTVRFDPGSQEFAWHAHEHYAELRKQSPVYRLLQPDGTEAWLITRYDDARAALADSRLSLDTRPMRPALDEARLSSASEVSASGMPQAFFQPFAPDMLGSDPPDHTRLRRLVGRAFTPRRIEGLRARVEDLTERLLDEMAGSDEVDLMAAFAYPLPITVICDLIGVPLAHRERVRRYADQIFSSEAARDALTSEGGAATFATFTEYLFDLVRKTAPLVNRDLPEDEQPSLLHALIIAADKEDRLTRAEIVDMLRLLLVAGHETTTNLIGNGTLALLRNPGQRDVLLRRPELLQNAVEELLRYDGPGERAIGRLSLEPITIGGITIPAHRLVYVVIASADHDPGHFPDPDLLDVSRPCPQHVGFGHGIHFCLGAPLARLEAQVAFGRLLTRFPTMELACPVEDLRFRAAGYLVRGLRTLPVRLHGEVTRGWA